MTFSTPFDLDSFSSSMNLAALVSRFSLASIEYAVDQSYCKDRKADHPVDRHGKLWRN